MIPPLKRNAILTPSSNSRSAFLPVSIKGSSAIEAQSYTCASSSYRLAFLSVSIKGCSAAPPLKRNVILALEVVLAWLAYPCRLKAALPLKRSAILAFGVIQSDSRPVFLPVLITGDPAIEAQCHTCARSNFTCVDQRRLRC